MRKLNREVAEYLRRHTPDGMEQSRVERCIEIVESPWTRRDEKSLWIAWTKEVPQPQKRAALLIEEIGKSGIEPFEPPAPMPPVEREEIHLVCWMGMVKE